MGLSKKFPYLKVGKLVKFDFREIDKWLKDRQIHEIIGHKNDKNYIDTRGV